MNESFTFWTKIIFSEMRKGSFVETKRNSFTFYILLANTCHNLGNIDVVTFRSCLHHVSKSIHIAKIFQCNVSRFVSCIIQLLVNLSFKTLNHTFTRLRFQLSNLRIMNNFIYFFELLFQCWSDWIHCFFPSNNVRDSNCEAMHDKPIINNTLSVR